ncbi:MAG: hypothetical protein KAJ76_05275 [Candidatus Heimdallarchaeota archaeon]|nr:hypothetical protein [Candidatus Heimdallarchaeota archaeon]
MVTDNALAIILGVLANSIYNVGLVFKRKGVCTLPEIEEQTVWQNIKNFAKCKSWVFGFSLTIIQWFPLMYAVKIGSLSLVAPTMAIGFIVLVIASWFLLKEPIRLVEILGILVVMGGLVALYVIAPIESGSYNLAEMTDFFRETNAIIYLCAFVVIIGVLISVTYGRKYAQAGGLLAMASGLCYALATIFAKGAIGSLGPGVIRDALRTGVWYLYLILMCVGYTIAFSTQQMAFQKGKAIVVSPTLDIMNLLTQVTAGILIFNEWTAIWTTMLPWQKTIKTLSIGLIVVGVAMLSIFSAEHDELIDGEKKDKITDEEEATLKIPESGESEDLDEEEKQFSLKEKIGTQKLDDSKSTIVGHQK